MSFSIKMTELQGAHPEVISDGEIAKLGDASALAGKEEVRGFDYTCDGKSRHWLAGTMYDPPMEGYCFWEIQFI